MRKPDLVFLTKENEERLKRFAENGAVCKSCGHHVIGPHDCPGIFEETLDATDSAQNDATGNVEECSSKTGA